MLDMNERFEAEMYESEQIAKAKVILRNESKQFDTSLAHNNTS